MRTFENMYLYVKPGCPYCMKADAFLAQAGIELEHRSVLEGTNAEDLRALGGKVQSPCLVIDGKPMYESDDIISYLRSAMSEFTPAETRSRTSLKSSGAAAQPALRPRSH